MPPRKGSCSGLARCGAPASRHPMVKMGHTAELSGSPASDSGATLLARVQGRQPEAWRRLVDLYGPLIYRWCRWAGLQPDDAGDVAQQVFASVAKSVGDFRPAASGGGFRAWLWGITRHRLLDWFRSRQGIRRPKAARRPNSRCSR